jgi:quercetin dioxygenase-like cupin family protein
MAPTSEHRATASVAFPATPPVDLGRVEGTGGVVWSVSPHGFHANLVVLPPGGIIERHLNDVVDVLLVVLAGSGAVTIEAETFDLAPGTAVLLPEGATRELAAGSVGLRYLSVHAERGPLTIGVPTAHTTPEGTR